MSKILRALGVAMLCVGLFSSAGMAMQEQMPAKEKKEQKEQQTTTLNGTVSAVTDSTVTIVDSQKAEHVLAVTSDTKVTKGGKDATIADVKANDTVAVEARKSDDSTWTALQISVS